MYEVYILFVFSVLLGLYDVENQCHDAAVLVVKYSPDGKSLLTASGDTTAKIHSVRYYNSNSIIEIETLARKLQLDY